MKLRSLRGLMSFARLRASAAIGAGFLAASTPNPATGATDLDAGNVQRLQLATSVRLPHVGAEASPPASLDGILLVLGSFPHTLYAIDPFAPPGQRVKWRFSPPADRLADGLSCCDRPGHGPVVEAGRVFFTTLDGHLVALDAASGALAFDVRVADPKAGETLAGAPLVAQGRVFVGSAGDDAGVRGWIAALDAGDGHPIWKRYDTGPDADVGIGADFKPDPRAPQGRDLGVATWPPSAWQQGGGNVTGTLLYDPASQTVFHGTGHPAPWNPDQRAGDNRWTAGFFARDAASGDARWFVGFNPGDPYAYRDGRGDLLVDRPADGEVRHLLIHPDGNGVLYVVDRSDGRMLAAHAVTGNIVAGVDLARGETRYRADKHLKVAAQTRGVCPAWTGGFGAGASRVGEDLVVLPVSRLCMDIEPRPANFIGGTPYAGANVRLRMDPADGGAVVGWDLAGAKPAWTVREPWPVMGGTAATASGLVFYGTLDGYLKALDGRDGKLLWQYKTSFGIDSRPLVFRSADGRTCVAVVAGTGRLHGASRSEALDPRDAGAGFGLAGLAGMLQRSATDPDPASTLLVFRLP